MLLESLQILAKTSNFMAKMAKNGKDIHTCVVRWHKLGTNEDVKNCQMKDSKTTFCCTRCTNLPRHGQSYLCITRETASRTITLRLNFFLEIN